MKKIFLVIVCFLSSFSLRALDKAPFMTNAYGRSSVECLNGEWDVIVDQYDMGAQRQLFMNRKASKGSEFYEYSWEGGLRLAVPGDWNSQVPELKFYEGTVWYARHIDFVPKANSRNFLYFAAVGNRCNVYLNGRMIAHHEGAFTPFQVEVTGLLQEGDNFLCLEVNNNRRADAIPAMCYDWWSYGGITRDVFLITTPELFVHDYSVALDRDDPSEIDVSVTLSDPVKEEVTFDIPELKIHKTLRTDSNGFASCTFKTPKALVRWAPDAPKLYDVTFAVKSDEVSERVGFRTLGTEGTSILVNGKKVFMRSVSFHEEIAQRMGRACSPSDARILLSEAAALGVNMVRLAHYPQNEHIVRLAEEMGIVLWEEIPLWQSIDFANPATRELAKDMYKEMIWRDHNRCSVCFWGIANETKPGEVRDAFLSEVLETAKSMDRTRLFAIANDVVYYKEETGRFEMKDSFVEKLDVVGVNKYMGWYAPWPLDPKDCIWNVAVDKPLIITEFGGEALYGRSGNEDWADSWSEDYQAKLYRDNLAMFDNIPNLAGVSPWVLFDFRSPYRFHPVNQDGWNRKGLVSNQGLRKKAWYVMRDYYGKIREADSGNAKVGTSLPLYKDPLAPIEQRVEDLLSRMTLEEKILQLNQYVLGNNDNDNNIGEVVSKIPPELGSVIYINDNYAIRNAMQKRCMEDTRLGIPMLFGYDVIHGFRTIFPIPLAQAASWNPDLSGRCAHVAALEAYGTGVDWTFSPMVDVARDPRWGRISEGFGEDPYTASRFSEALVKGYQGDDLSKPGNIAACLKHYVGYGASEAGRDYVPTEISRQTLWDTYLPPFKAGVKAGAATLMSSFNNISGTPASANRYTLTEVRKNMWKHDGFVVSDWDAVKQLINQGMAEDGKEAAGMAFNAGIEMDMVDNLYRMHLPELVEEGKVSIEDIDEAVRRVLRVKFRLGLFDNPYTPESAPAERYLRKEYRSLALEAAVESAVLLKNDGVLPLSGKKRVALFGPLADDAVNMLGRWAGRGRGKDCVTILAGMKSAFGDVSYVRGCGFDSKEPCDYEAAVAAAKDADVCVVCLGEKNGWSGENASRSSTLLPAEQRELLEAVKTAGKPVVLLLGSGRPLDVTTMAPLADAVMEIWQMGVEEGNAVAGLLSGKYVPSGKLPVTFPYTDGQIPIFYNRRNSGRRGTQGLYQDIQSTPMYEFAYGLSYTTFEYSPVSLSSSVVASDGRATAKVTVRNTGSVDAKETVHWFVTDPSSTITRPVRELRFFEKRLIPAGQSVDFIFEIEPLRDLGFVDEHGNEYVDKGKYYICVGSSKVEITVI